MPTYDYVCSACGHEMEAFQSMKDSPLRKCPQCKRMKLSRKIGLGAGLIFKGSGFYETDYRRPAEKKDGGGDSEAKPESKPGAQAEGKGGDSKKTDSDAKGSAKKKADG